MNDQSHTLKEEWEELICQVNVNKEKVRLWVCEEPPERATSHQGHTFGLGGMLLLLLLLVEYWESKEVSRVGMLGAGFLPGGSSGPLRLAVGQGMR